MKTLTQAVDPILLFLLFMLAPIHILQAEEIESAEERGKVEFVDSCSLCHGEDAKGNGIFSSMLKVETPDLTQLSRNNGGVFPYREVYFIIDGRDTIKQHGPRHMPIWGDRFKSTTWFTVNQDYAETLVRGTIFELLLYLESIQQQ